MSAKPKDPMRSARAEAVKLALEHQVPFCVLADYRIVALPQIPKDCDALGVAYPSEYRFVYCDPGYRFRAPHLARTDQTSRNAINRSGS